MKFVEVRADDLIAITFLGLGFVLAIWQKQTEIALTVGGGLGGYLGAVVNGEKSDKD